METPGAVSICPLAVGVCANAAAGKANNSASKCLTGMATPLLRHASASGRTKKRRSTNGLESSAHGCDQPPEHAGRRLPVAHPDHSQVADVAAAAGRQLGQP